MKDRLSDIRITAEPDPGSFAEEIEANLLASLRQNLPASDYRPFGLLARTGDGEIQGGLIGGTSYGWLLVKILWVAEEAAALRGCHGAWLDTSSRRARSFYEIAWL